MGTLQSRAPGIDRWFRGRLIAALLLGLVYLAAAPNWAATAEPAAAPVPVAAPAAETNPAPDAKPGQAAEKADQADVQAGVAPVAAEPQEPPYSLRLTNGDHVTGKLIDSPAGADLAWMAPGFAGPFSVPRDITQEIQVSAAVPAGVPAGKYCFLMAHGARLFGSLLAIDDRTVSIEVAGVGRLEVDRSGLYRMYRADSPTLVYVGPQGLDGWRMTGPKDAWHGDGSQLSTESVQSGLVRDFGDLPRACFEIDISAKGPPNFSIAFGVDLNPNVVRNAGQPVAGAAAEQYPKPPVGAFFCETWARTLIIKRETEHEADFVDLESELLFNSTLRLQVFIDQIKGRMIVMSDTGKLLGELTVPGNKPPVGNAIWLTNKSGSLTLNALRVSRWNGDEPQPVALDEQRLHRIDGGIVRGAIRSFDGERRQFTVDCGEGRIETVDEDQLQDVVLAPVEGEDDDSLWCVVDRQGMQFSGKIDKIENDSLWLECPGIHQPIALALSAIKSISPRRPVTKPVKGAGNAVFTSEDGSTTTTGAPPVAKAADPGHPGPAGRLEMADMAMHGFLTSPPEGSPTCLAWQPAWSKTGAALMPSIAGRIVYHEPSRAATAQARNTARVQLGMAKAVVQVQVVGAPGAPPPPPQAPAVAPPQQGAPGAPPPQQAPAFAPPQPGAAIQQALVDGTLGKQGSQNSGENLSKYPSVLHLWSGDNIRCTVTKIDEQGVTMATPAADATFVPNAQLMALELVVDGGVVISKTKQDRLLMTPRMQRASPPTHLIRSTSGDYLRGRLLAMDDMNLEIEIRLESKTIPRAAIARIIWLHPETDKAAASAESPPGLIRLQAIDRDGKRLTMFGESFAETTISGRNDVLGQCRIDVSGIDQLYLGPAVELAAADLPFHQWKLTTAPDPLSDTEDEGSTGADSPLVGKPAPAFEIQLAGGGRFRWDDYHDKIVVLDFWASWCGPCMQTLPQVDKVAEEFAAQGVCLVAVNLQETPDQIKQTLERLELKTVVGLDSDGAVAKKYGANAIPQTVIVGRDGKVARVFVGGSSHFDEQLRTALESVLTGKPESAE